MYSQMLASRCGEVGAYFICYYYITCFITTTAATFEIHLLSGIHYCKTQTAYTTSTTLYYTPLFTLRLYCLPLPLPLVGAFMLADYILSAHEVFKEGRTAIELGSGTGLCSIILGFAGCLTFATDYKLSILQNTDVRPP